MLQVTDLTKIYNRLVANDHLNFTVNPGEIAVLLGPNGAGKSTAIRCIAGLLSFQGNITICGHPNKSVEAKKEFGYIPEMPALFEALTVREHLEFIARAYKVENWEKKADALLERMELDDKQNKLGGELSKGMQQKVSICCALLPKPRAIIFDEPMVGLDPHAIKELKELFQELREDGCSVLISTHMLDSVEDFWDTAHIMMNGSFAATKQNGEDGDSLEKLFFDITEGKAVEA